MDVDENRHDIPGIENMEEARANFILERFKAYSVDGMQLTDAAVTPFSVTLESISNGHYECLFFKVETGSGNIVYPSEMQSGFVYNSEKGLYLAYTDIGIWKNDPQTQDAEKITSDYYDGENLYELRDAQGAINFYWIDGVELSPDGSSVTTAFINRVNLASGELTPITEVIGYLDAEPRFSPSGAKAIIGYGTDPMIGITDVMLVDLASGEQTLLTDLLTDEQQVDGLIRHCRWVNDDTLVVNVQNSSNFQSYSIRIIMGEQLLGCSR